MKRFDPTSNRSLQQFIDESEGTIVIPSGYYQECLIIKNSRLTIIGEGQVVIDQRRGVAKQANLTTYQTATVYLLGNGICLKNITIQNSAGPSELAGQAVALFIDGDEVVVEGCRLYGHQDTLYLGQPKELLPTKRNEVLFRNCYIEGDIDFIFGSAAALFERCEIVSNALKLGYLTAPATPEDQAVGFVFYHCRFTQLLPDAVHYLARPWRDYGKVCFLSCIFALRLTCERWDDWGKLTARETCDFAEWDNQFFYPSHNAAWTEKNAREKSLYINYFEKVKERWKNGH